jgi:hypothetical protein
MPRPEPSFRQGSLRQTVEFARAFSAMTHVKALRKKYSTFFFSEIMVVSAHPASPKRGVSRSSRAWRRDAVGASGCGVIYHADERSGAHGEIVWSWRPGADAERIAHRALS